MLEWRATVRPEVAALVDDRGAVYSYARLRAEYERRAGGWAELGIGPGDEVAIVAKNSADFLVHTFAVLRAGATPAFVNWRLSPGELAEVLALVEPAAVAADAEFTGPVNARDPRRDRRRRPGPGGLAGRRRSDRSFAARDGPAWGQAGSSPTTSPVASHQSANNRRWQV